MIKVGYLVSSEYKLVYHSIALIYPHVDEIYLAIDKDLLTYGGNAFTIEDSFYETIRQMDKDNKIKYYYDSFYVPTLNGLECETRERNMLAKKMGKGWLIQLDTDEYPYDFEPIAQFLRKYNFLTHFSRFFPITFSGKWITLFKQTEDGYISIAGREKFYFATNIHHYTFSRQNTHNYYIDLGAEFIHNSWARSEQEIAFKLQNWGHKDDFDTAKFFAFWQSLNKDNYMHIKDFHPLNPVVWKALEFVPAKDIADYTRQFAAQHKQTLNKLSFMSLLKIFVKNLIGRH